jgi:hypothetical protein
MLTILYAVCTRTLTYVNTVQKLSILEVFLQITSSFFGCLRQQIERKRVCVDRRKTERKEVERKEGWSGVQEKSARKWEWERMARIDSWVRCFKWNTILLLSVSALVNNRERGKVLRPLTSQDGRSIQRPLGHIPILPNEMLPITQPDACSFVCMVSVPFMSWITLYLRD